MKVLVTVGSKHGSTQQIGAAVRDALAEAGIEAEQVAPEQVKSLDG